MTEKKLNGTQLADIYIQKFKSWTDSMESENYAPFVYRGNLSRANVATECGFDRQILTKNPTIKRLLQELEDRLREENVLPAKNLSTDDDKVLLDSASIKASREQSRIPKLEQHIIELQAQVNALKGQLGRFSELSEVYDELTEMNNERELREMNAK